MIIPSAFFIGILSGLFVKSILGICNLKFYPILVLEFLFIVGISISLLLWRFYRDPRRIPPEDKTAILSPADGRVIYVKRIEQGVIPYIEKKGEKVLFKDFTQSDVFPREAYLIGISMNFLNVHVNRAPIEGKISLVKHIQGKFISLRRKEGLIENERALTVIDNGQFKVGIVQIASRLVRKIVVYLHEGSFVQKGERIGMIRFGSQVDLFLPNVPILHILVKPGEEVKAGISIIGRMVADRR